MSENTSANLKKTQGDLPQTPEVEQQQAPFDLGQARTQLRVVRMSGGDVVGYVRQLRTSNRLSPLDQALLEQQELGPTERDLLSTPQEVSGAPSLNFVKNQKQSHNETKHENENPHGENPQGIGPTLENAKLSQKPLDGNQRVGEQKVGQQQVDPKKQEEHDKTLLQEDEQGKNVHKDDKGDKSPSHLKDKDDHKGGPPKDDQKKPDNKAPHPGGDDGGHDDGHGPGHSSAANVKAEREFIEGELAFHDSWKTYAEGDAGDRFAQLLKTTGSGMADAAPSMGLMVGAGVIAGGVNKLQSLAKGPLGKIPVVQGISGIFSSVALFGTNSKGNLGIVQMGKDIAQDWEGLSSNNGFEQLSSLFSLIGRIADLVANIANVLSTALLVAAGLSFLIGLVFPPLLGFIPAMMSASRVLGTVGAAMFVVSSVVSPLAPIFKLLYLVTSNDDPLKLAIREQQYKSQVTNATTLLGSTAVSKGLLPKVQNTGSKYLAKIQNKPVPPKPREVVWNPYKTYRHEISHMSHALHHDGSKTISDVKKVGTEVKQHDANQLSINKQGKIHEQKLNKINSKTYKKPQYKQTRINQENQRYAKKIAPLENANRQQVDKWDQNARQQLGKGPDGAETISDATLALSHTMHGHHGGPPGQHHEEGSDHGSGSQTDESSNETAPVTFETEYREDPGFQVGFGFRPLGGSLTLNISSGEGKITKLPGPPLNLSQIDAYDAEIAGLEHQIETGEVGLEYTTALKTQTRLSGSLITALDKTFVAQNQQHVTVGKTEHGKVETQNAEFKAKTGQVQGNQGADNIQEQMDKGLHWAKMLHPVIPNIDAGGLGKMKHDLESFIESQDKVKNSKKDKQAGNEKMEQIVKGRDEQISLAKTTRDESTTLHEELRGELKSDKQVADHGLHEAQQTELLIKKENQSTEEKLAERKAKRESDYQLLMNWAIEHYQIRDAYQKQVLHEEP